MSDISTPTSSVVFDIPSDTKAINIASYDLAVSGFDSILVQLGDNDSFTTSGYSDLNAAVWSNGFAFGQNISVPQTQMIPLIVSDKKYIGIVLSRCNQGVQSIQLPYVATRIRVVCRNGASLTGGTIIVNFSK